MTTCKTARSFAERAVFIEAHTRLLPVPFVPELRLHTADEATALWEKTEADLGRLNLPPPFWAFPWAGGQALARFLLDDPGRLRAEHVLDFASGSGLCAIAAAKVGGTRVEAVDIDPYAAAAITLNARANAVDVAVTLDDIIGRSGAWTTILAGDISYQKDLADRVHAWLAAEARRGVRVLIGDPGRSYLPRATLRQLASYDVPVNASLEDAAVKETFVFTLESAQG